MQRSTIARILVVLACIALLVTNQVYPQFLTALSTVQVDNFSVVVFAILALSVLQPYITNAYNSTRTYAVKYTKTLNRRWVIIITCLALIILRLFNTSTQLDINIIWLVGIAALLFVLPDLKSVAPYVKRVKFGDAELELKEKIGDLGKEVEKAEEAAAENSSTGVTKESTQKVSDEVEEILQESSRNPRAALLLLSSRLEEQLRDRLEESGISSRKYPISKSVEIGVGQGLFPKEFLSAFRDFWAVRNRVAHGSAFDVDDAYILSLISLGTQLLKIVSTFDGQLKMDL